MSSRSVNTGTYTLPPNPVYLEFKKSDGNASSWPTTTTRIIDTDGSVNFFEYLPPENGQNTKWRHQVGEAVAKSLGMPAGPKYVLKSFPDGYRFYNHHKGPAVKPRQDVYLYGAPAKRFRSIREFISHAAWLMNDAKGDCECKYCSKRTQKTITAELGAAGVIPAASQSMSPAPLKIKISRDKGKARDPLNRPKELRERDTRVYAAVQRVAKPSQPFEPFKPSAHILNPPMLVERNHDLRAIYSTTSMQLRRWFREGEVVWCSLDPPISAPENPEISIQLWPGVVEEVKLRSVPVPRETGRGDSSSSTSRAPTSPQSNPTTSQLQATTKEDGIGPQLEPNDNPLPWTVRQSTRYKVQLLAVSHSYTIADDQVLPYTAHVPPDEVVNFMLSCDPDKLAFDKESLSLFNPCPGTSSPSIFDAVAPYATALQIASALASYWSLTDEYELKYAVSSPPTSTRPPLPSRIAQPSTPMPPPSSIPLHKSLSDAINEASENNAQAPIDINPDSYYRSLEGIGSNMSESDVQEVSRRVIGVPPPPGPLVQTRFQGIWWGTERIWTSDFIRVKIPRRTLAPSGADNILPPAGASKSELEASAGLDIDLSAGNRGVFLRLDGIFTVDVPSADGLPKKEARVCGMLYELAHEDWEEPDEQESAQPTNSLEHGLSPESGPAGPFQDGPSGTARTPASNGSLPPADGILQDSDFIYILPQAPIGYKFRPILKPGFEFVAAMGLISGRYYPRILTHPRLRQTVNEALVRPISEGGMEASNNLWALEGLSGGYFNSMDPFRYKKSRLVMLQDADLDALEMLKTYAQTKQNETQLANGNGNGQANDSAMESDIDVDMEEMYA